MSVLFSPYALRSMKLPNRIVISPMCQYSAERGEATAWHMIHLGSLALSGAGLLIIEATGVSVVIKNNVMTTYHYAGTCRMGKAGDRDAVVDEQLRARGILGLRIADASTIPSVPVSAMNAPSMLLGYRASRFIIEGP